MGAFGFVIDFLSDFLANIFNFGQKKGKTFCVPAVDYVKVDEFEPNDGQSGWNVKDNSLKLQNIMIFLSFNTKTITDNLKSDVDDKTKVGNNRGK